MERKGAIVDRLEVYNTLSDLLLNTDIDETTLYEIVDFILDNFEPRGGVA